MIRIEVGGLGKLFGENPPPFCEWTEAEDLYFRYRVSKDPAVKKDCRGRLAAICIKAVGHLTPPWKGKWNPEFDSLRHKARAPWVYRWLDEQLKVPQQDMCQFIGRRCHHALADEIRAVKRKHRVKPDAEPAAPPSPGQIMALRQQYMATLGKHMRHATKSSELTPDERLLAFDSIVELRPIKNVEMAKRLDCSEGQVRKIRGSLLRKVKLGKEQRRRHYEEKDTRQRRADYRAKQRAGKRGVKDVVWWDKKPGGKPFEIIAKK